MAPNSLPPEFEGDYPLPPVRRPHVPKPGDDDYVAVGPPNDRPYGPIPGDPDYVPITPPPNTRLSRVGFFAIALGVIVLFFVLVSAFGN